MTLEVPVGAYWNGVIRAPPGCHRNRRRAVTGAGHPPPLGTDVHVPPNTPQPDTETTRSPVVNVIEAANAGAAASNKTAAAIN